MVFFKNKIYQRNFVLYNETSTIKEYRKENPDLFISLKIDPKKRGVIGPTWNNKDEDIFGWMMAMETMIFESEVNQKMSNFAKLLQKNNINLYKEYVLKVINADVIWKNDIEKLLLIEKEINSSLRDLEKEKKRLANLKHKNKAYKEHVDLIKRIFHGISNEIDMEEESEKRFLHYFINFVRDVERHRDEFEKKMNSLRENFPFLFNHNGVFNHTSELVKNFYSK
ncbi:MAG: hypothetical protein PHT94_00105 [Candidatus Nanoarchaeia archaeon]|nr:hypothetical protein [Candidatus Nanoarchaeia archaeon]